MFRHRFHAPASRDLKQNTRDQNSGGRPRPCRVFRGETQNPSIHRATSTKTFEPQRLMFLSNVKSPDRAVAAQPVTAGKPVAAANRQAPSFAALLRAHAFIQSSVVNTSVDPGQRPDGPARGRIVGVIAHVPARLPRPRPNDFTTSRIACVNRAATGLGARSFSLIRPIGLVAPESATGSAVNRGCSVGIVSGWIVRKEPRAARLASV